MKVWDIAAIAISLGPCTFAAPNQGERWVDLKSHGKDDAPYLVRALKVSIEPIL